MKTKGDIYRKAAKLIEDGAQHYSCIAIVVQAKNEHGDCPDYREHPPATEYVQTFATNPDALLAAFDRCGKQSQNVRATALCFMAAIADTETSKGAKQ